MLKLSLECLSMNCMNFITVPIKCNKGWFIGDFTLNFKYLNTCKFTLIFTNKNFFLSYIINICLLILKFLNKSTIEFLPLLHLLIVFLEHFSTAQKISY